MEKPWSEMLGISCELKLFFYFIEIMIELHHSPPFFPPSTPSHKLLFLFQIHRAFFSFVAVVYTFLDPYAQPAHPLLCYPYVCFPSMTA